MLIAIPAFRLSCMVGIDKGRAWSVVDEVMLWANARESRTISDLSKASGLPHQVVVASLARLMRFRLVEVTVDQKGASFRASAYGREIVESGRTLPFFPKREKKRVSFVVEQVTGTFFPTGLVRIVSKDALNNDPDPDVRVIVVNEGGPPMTHEANLSRLSQIAARGWEEQLAFVDGRTAIMRNEYMVVKIVDGVPRNLPETADDALKAVVAKVSALGKGNPQVPINYRGPVAQSDAQPIPRPCSFDSKDLVIGGSAQLTCLRELIASAQTRVLIHSTFLDHNKFKDLLDDIRAACLRGVTFDLLWGAEVEEGVENRNATSAAVIAKAVREDRDVQRRFHVHARSTGSHAKILLADTEHGDWVAAVGSCNWLSTPFRAVELTAVLRDPHVVADVAVSLQRMLGRRGLSDDIATEMAFLATELRRLPASTGQARVTLVVGDGHDAVMRQASGAAARRVMVGTHRLGSTARPGMVMPAEAAVQRANVDVTLIYTQASGPLKNRHARTLTEEAAGNGLRLYKAPIPLHGKFVAWDDDDVVVTSLNWGSARSDADFPQADVGVHVSAPGIGLHVTQTIESIFPALADAGPAGEPVRGAQQPVGPGSKG